MQTIIKQTREVGTSAGVLLPRKWLNKQVVVTLLSPSKKDIIKEVLDILIEKDLNQQIKGIYLYGSYARGDYDAESDIDILVLTHNVNKLINHKNYEFILVSEESFSKNISNSLNYSSILKEAETIINQDLIEKYKNKKYKLNIKKLLSEIKSVLRINKESIEMYKNNNESIPDGIIYSIVLRLRELLLIKCLNSNKNYSKKEFQKWVNEKTYQAYLRIKRDDKEINNTTYTEAKSLIDLSEKWLKEIKE